MKLAIIGSRSLCVINLDNYLPEGITEIVSGGARGVDRQASEWARRNNIPIKEFLPDYKRYGRSAPLKRNEEIAKYADSVIALWDGYSKGTMHTVSLFRDMGKPVILINLN